MSNNKTNQTGKNAPGKDDGLNAFAKGKLTPHKLSKKAAKVAQDLRDGELAPEDVSRMMREALEKEAMEQLTQAFGKMQGLNKVMHVNRIDSVQIMLGGDLLLSDLSCAHFSPTKQLAALIEPPHLPYHSFIPNMKGTYVLCCSFVFMSVTVRGSECPWSVRGWIIHAATLITLCLCLGALAR